MLTRIASTKPVVMEPLTEVSGFMGLVLFGYRSEQAADAFGHAVRHAVG